MSHSAGLKKLCVSLLFAAHFAYAADERVTLNFVNSDIESTIKAVGLISGKNFVIDPRVKGTINIVSATPVSKDLVYPILLSSLRLQGFAAVESLGTVKIVPEADAKQHFSATEGPVSVTPARCVVVLTPAQAAIRTEGRLPLMALTRAVTRR